MMTDRIRMIAGAWLIGMTGLSIGRGDVQLSPVISENAVLQRDARVPVWGWADPGEVIAVTFAGQSRSSTADRFGHWRVELDPIDRREAGWVRTLSPSERSRYR